MTEPPVEPQGCDGVSLPEFVVCPACAGSLEAASPGVRCRSCGAVYPCEQGILRLSGRRQADRPGYDPHFFDGLLAVEERHFWYVTRRRAIAEALRRFVPDLPSRTLVDIGCGSGGMLKYLGAMGVRVAGGCDAYIEGLRLARGRIAAPLVEVDEAGRLPIAPGQRLLGLFDVLEHLDDDAGVLSWLCSRLAPGGALVLSVPAHPFLFDEMDVLACHRRRYRRGELRRKLEAAGFEVRWVSHVMACLVAPLVAFRWLGRRVPGAATDAHRRRTAELRILPLVNGALRAVLAAESRLTYAAGGLPFGTSLIAVAVRPD